MIYSNTNSPITYPNRISKKYFIKRYHNYYTIRNFMINIKPTKEKIQRFPIILKEVHFD